MAPPPCSWAPRPSAAIPCPGPAPLWAPPRRSGPATLTSRPRPLRSTTPQTLGPAPAPLRVPQAPPVPAPPVPAPPPRPGHAQASRAAPLLCVPAFAAARGRRLGQRGECLGCLPPARIRSAPWGEQASAARGASAPGGQGCCPLAIVVGAALTATHPPHTGP